MKKIRSHSLNNIGRAIYPLRILGFTLFSISILLSYSKLSLDLDSWAIVGIVVCLIYPQLVFIRYIKNNERRDIEINHMFIDMGVQGAMAALVSLTPSVILPYLIANSAANYALRGIKQSLKAVILAITVATLIHLIRDKEIVYSVDTIELLGPFIYLIVVTHYMGFLAYVRGISLIRRRKEAEELAQIDFLTKLKNRRSVFEHIGQTKNEACKKNNTTTLVMIDLDHFKKINDLHGHDHGDEVLVQLSLRFKNTLRKTDIIARWGGEEF